ncbi:MAG: putative toxin-antitoxin system toxin component, PIN family [Chloroflexota bacterium]|nr:putative toxin-antitoxin system toxin component, PIN family [Chloroflexota bacterium]
MIRAVLDANVFASGVLGFDRESSTPGALLRAWERRAFDLITSEALIVEIERTLANPYFTARVSERVIRLTLAALKEDAIETTITVAVTGVATHPEDDLVLAAAASALANYLVTGDKQLQLLKSYGSVAIVGPKEFLAHIA